MDQRKLLRNAGVYLSSKSLENNGKNAETDINFIDSDHYPLIAEIQVKLKTMPNTKLPQRVKYEPAKDRETILQPANL